MDKAKEELAELVRRKSMLSETLVNIERDIYTLEGAYLESTKDYGNVIKGWDRYLSYGKTSNNSTAVNEKRKFRQSQRIFSRSSVTSMSALGIAEKVDTTHIDEVDQVLQNVDMSMPGTSSIKESPKQVIKRTIVSSKTTGGKPPLGELRMTLASRPTVVETKPAVNRKRLPIGSRSTEQPVMSMTAKEALRKSKVH